MQIAIVQFRANPKDIEENFKKIFDYMVIAKSRNADLVVFPEMSLSGYYFKYLDYQIEYIEKNDLVEKLFNLAVDNQISINIGLPYNGYNASLFINHFDQKKYFYFKSHLIKLFDEHKVFKRGEDLQIVKFKDFNIGLSICYDLRFPELFRKYTLAYNVDIIFNISQWPKSRLYHFKILSIARAIENQVFFISVNGCGKVGNTLFGGNSLVITPQGEIIKELPSDESVDFVEVSKNSIKDLRQSFPVLEDFNEKDFIV